MSPLNGLISGQGFRYSMLLYLLERFTTRCTSPATLFQHHVHFRRILTESSGSTEYEEEGNEEFQVHFRARRLLIDWCKRLPESLFYRRAMEFP